MEERKMKCPNCGKKMKKDTCKKCGYSSAAKANPTMVAANSATKVNYFTYDPKNPGVVYPMSVTATTPIAEEPAVKSAREAKTDFKAAQATAKDGVKAAQFTAKAADVTAKAEAKIDKIEEKTAKKAAAAEKKAAKKAAKAAKAAAAAEKKAAKKIAAAEKAAEKAAKAATKAELKAAKADLKAKKELQKVAEASEREDIKTTKKAEKKAAKAAVAAEKAAQQAARAEQRAARAEQEAAKAARKIEARKNWTTRLFAVGLVFVSFATLLVLSFGAVLSFVTVGDKNVPNVAYGSLINILAAASASGEKVFGILPALFAGNGGDLYNIAIYVFVICTVLSAIYAILANISVDAAPKRVTASLLLLAVGALFYSVSMAVLLNSATLTPENLENLNMIVIRGFKFDSFSLILGGASLLLCFVHALPHNND